MNNLPSNPTIEQVDEEILFNRMLLDTLDPSSAFYHQDKAAKEQDLRNLRSLHEQMISGRLNPASARAAPSQQSSLANGLNRPRNLPFPQTPAPPSSSRKRFRPVDDTLTSDHVTKSLRSTPAPSPAATTPGTPSSSDSLEVYEGGLDTRSVHAPNRMSRLPPNRNFPHYTEQRRQPDANASMANEDAELAGAWQIADQARQSQSQAQSSFAVGATRPIQPRAFPYSSTSARPQPVKAEQSRTLLRQSSYTHFANRPQPPPRSGGSNNVEVIDLSGDTDDEDSNGVVEMMSHPRPLPVRTQPHAFGTPSALGQRRGFGRELPLPESINDSYASNSASGIPLQQSWMSSTGRAVMNAGRSIYNTLQNGIPAIGGLSDNLDDIDQRINGTTSSRSGESSTGFNFDGANPFGMYGRHVDPYSSSSSASRSMPVPGSYPSFTGRTAYPSFDDYDYDSYGLYNRHSYPHFDQHDVQEDLKKMLANIRPDDEIPPNLREGTPEGMVHPLMEHQKLGLAWLKKMEEGSTKGGILADDMGLGKTIQALALIVSRPSEDPLRKTTLILAPVALMRQWEREIKTKIRPGRHALSVHVHHGAGKRLKFKELSQFDVVLTSYGTLAAELSRKENWRKSLVRDEDGLMRGKKPDDIVLLDQDSLWYRCILDEAQCIKNRETKTSRAATELQSTYRWCMTGTPMMNKVEELFSLIRFLRIPPYHEWDRFRADIKAPLEGKSHKMTSEAGMKKLQAVLKAILLRRNKDSKIDGKPIFTLPPKTVSADHVMFDDEQAAFYGALETRTQLTFNKYLKAGTVGKQYSHILVLLLRLRQACCHPHLIRDFAERISTDLTDEDMETLALQLSGDVVARIKAEEGAFSCPICLDAVENPAIFLPCGHNTCAECFSTLSDPSRNLANGNENATDLKCPNCRGKIDTNRIIDYRSFQRVYLPNHINGVDGLGDLGFGAGGATETDEAEASETDGSDEEDDDEDDETNSLDGFIVNDEEGEAADDGEDGGEANVNEANGTEASSSAERPEAESAKKAKQKKSQGKGKSKGKGKTKDKGKGKAKDKKKTKKKTKTLAELRREGLRNKAAKKEYFQRLAKDWLTSAKIDRTLEVLREVRDEDPTEKTLIFSQFTSLLDLLEIPLIHESMDFVRFDGSMLPNERNDAVNHFIESPTCNIMLISLKAGNAGLNLNAASQVIVLDPFWNPYIEYQAIDRAHRLGQQRPVHVHRILVPNTVEDRIMDLQRKKEELISTALDENAGKNIARLGVQELAYLFGVRNTLPQANGG